ncbi:MAG: transketolase [Myxococcaceae bacterium]|jgi:transketolase|nr:transketolase [Myxococcaceae bacterium]
MTASARELDLLCINTLRTLAIDVIQKADSGHPGLPLGAAPMAWVLWNRHLKHSPADPAWADRDRFVLSAGHGSMLLYGLLHLHGYPLSWDEVLNFRQWRSKTPGHPEFGLTPGVEATTGPLGQGHANAVGMAIAERALAARFNRPGHVVVDHFTYCLVGDGDVMEGVAMEAASLAGHLKLGKLICLYDSNDVTLDGPAKLSFTEDVARRYESWGWQVLHVADGNTDLDGLDAALAAARAETGKPSFIVVKTTIGFGSPNKSGKSSSHGSPLGKDEIALTKKALGWDPERSLWVPEAARAKFLEAVDAGKRAQAAWQATFDGYARAFPELAREFQRVMAGELPSGVREALPTFAAGQGVETRTAAGQALNALAVKVPELLGGDADLGGSTKTVLKDGGSFDGQTGAGRNIHFGVREHAMAAIANGMAYHGGVRPFTATFFCFSDYMRPSVRLAAMNHLPVVHVWTHDSIGLGEDGPTHQPVEHLLANRAIPNLHVVRPADAAEAAEAWRYALERREGPTGLVLTRQKVPVFDRAMMGAAEGLHRGAYVLAEASGGTPRLLLIGTGSEVQLCVAAREALEKEGVPTRVVSMPCQERFRAQPKDYQAAVLPPAVTARVSVEAGVTLGWERFVGDRGVALGVDTYGASAPDRVLFEQYGLTVAKVVAAAKALL